MTPAFLKAVNIILDHEGGKSLNPKDPGNWTGGAPGKGILKGTNCGISAKTYPDLDIMNLTKDQIKQIYFDNYWNKVRGDMLPWGVALVTFDLAVTSGPATAIKKLQEAVGAKVDGVLGDRTLYQVNALTPESVIQRLTTIRILYYTTLKNWKDACGGWTRRTVETLTLAIQHG